MAEFESGATLIRYIARSHAKHACLILGGAALLFASAGLAYASDPAFVTLYGGQEEEQPYMSQEAACDFSAMDWDNYANINTDGPGHDGLDSNHILVQEYQLDAGYTTYGDTLEWLSTNVQDSKGHYILYDLADSSDVFNRDNVEIPVELIWGDPQWYIATNFAVQVEEEFGLPGDSDCDFIGDVEMTAYQY